MDIEEKSFEEGQKSSYSGEDIVVLEGLEPVRERPGMYIGSTGINGLHQLVYEVVDNSIDEAMAGYCNEVRITLENTEHGEVCTVSDNGRGIPVDVIKEYGKSALEIVLTRLHAGGKFGHNSYKVSGGLHGVGVSCVNALSSYFQATVYRSPHIYRQTFSKGIPLSDVEIIGDTDKTGTTISFSPDFEIMEVNSFDYETLHSRFRELSFLNKGVRISIEDKRVEPVRSESFQADGGLKSYIKYLNEYKTTLFDTISIEGRKGDIAVEIALQYNDKYDENIHTFVNNINTREGGMHRLGFQDGLTRCLNKQHEKNQRIFKKYDKRYDWKDISEGLTAVVSVKMPDPQFEGQTKMKLGNSAVRGIVANLVNEKLTDYFDEFPVLTELLLEKITNAALGREAAQKAREGMRKKSEGGGLPGKLADCSKKDPAECEVFIVEGDSAGGSAKSGRDREFQAILPLWGKMLNVEKAPEVKVLGNDKLEPVIQTIGAGITRYNEKSSPDDPEDKEKSFDIEKVRYHKIIIMADADVDGSHIRTLLLTFFYRYMRPIIEAGYVYFAMPPLYKFSGPRISEPIYAYTEDERQKKFEEAVQLTGDPQKVAVQRYKGLGEMNPDQLWETTMNPATRMLGQVHLSDAEEADRVFSMLMGEEVEPRREFIEKNAQFATNLDF